MSRLLRVGDSVINLATVADIQMKLGGEVHVHFSGPVDDAQIPVNRLELRGQEAEALRRWIGSEVEYCEGSGGKQDEAAKRSEPPQAPPLRIPQGPPPQDSYSRFGRVLWAFGCAAGYYTQESQAAALRRVG
jgi:hypothetical protein